MINLDSIEISGVSTTGEFVGSIGFSEGLQVVSAHNAFGKSLAVTAIAWCVGGEAVFGIPDNDPHVSLRRYETRSTWASLHRRPLSVRHAV